MTTQTHTVASCPIPDCGWEADGPKADTHAAKHSDKKANGGREHPTVTRTHPTTHCHREGCHD